MIFSAPKVELTSDQLKAIDFLDCSRDFSILAGSAGVGKTTILPFLKKRADDRGLSIKFTATTHKASQVLREKLSIYVSTIHSFLKLKRQFTGREYEFVFDAESVFELPDILVIDESSMIDEFLFTCIFKVMKGRHVIFVGDKKQLNPVGSTQSIVFNQGIESFELTEIIRHQNDIIDLSRNLHWLNAKINGKNFKWYEMNEVPMQDLVMSNGGDDAKFITWTNRTVEAVNKEIRKMIYSEVDVPCQIGETILMREAYKEIYRNNEEVCIEELTDNAVHFDGADIPYPSIETYIVNQNMDIVKRESREAYQKNLKILKEKAKLKMISWKHFFDYQELFGNYQFNHAITVHKAQGSTYKKSFIYISEIMRNPNVDERTRMLYTAVTRASQQNILI